MALPALRLKKNEDKRLRQGHLWIFSNEVDIRLTPLKSLEPGGLVRVQDAAGHDIGLALISPQSLICARLISRDSEANIDSWFFQKRLAQALALREAHFPTPHYRLVHGEGDFLPGLVIDRYGDQLVMQTSTWGMEKSIPLIVEALERLLPGSGILLKNTSSTRALEGLPEQVEVLSGAVPEQLEVVENGLRFRVPARSGQKTGWFYDHRANRVRLRDWSKDKRVLDIFSYVGGWGLQAAGFGAKELVSIDSSQAALAQLRENAGLNGLADRVDTRCGDAFTVVKDMQGQEQFDLVILDPPAFIKSRKHLSEGVQAYRRINQMALALLKPGGLLVSASCSHHLSRDMLLEQINRGASQSDIPLQLLAEGHQDLDHPVHPAIPESAYIKALYLYRAMRPTWAASWSP